MFVIRGSVVAVVSAAAPPPLVKLRVGNKRNTRMVREQSETSPMTSLHQNGFERSNTMAVHSNLRCDKVMCGAETMKTLCASGSQDHDFTPITPRKRHDFQTPLHSCSLMIVLSVRNVPTCWCAFKRAKIIICGYNGSWLHG
jgi:hypothetical protein